MLHVSRERERERERESERESARVRERGRERERESQSPCTCARIAAHGISGRHNNLRRKNRKPPTAGSPAFRKEMTALGFAQKLGYRLWMMASGARPHRRQSSRSGSTITQCWRRHHRRRRSLWSSLAAPSSPSSS